MARILSFFNRRAAQPAPARADNNQLPERGTAITLRDLLKSTYSDDDIEGAAALAAIFNADRKMRLALSEDGDHTAVSILRMGEIIKSYAPRGLPRAAQLDTQIVARDAVAQAVGQPTQAVE